MTLTELRYIVALAHEQHFGRAALACFVAQPTLSVAVKKLEDELGVALFERSSQEVRATPTGEQVVAQAEKVLAEVARLAELAGRGRDPLIGPLRLGVIPTIGPWLLPQLVPLLKMRAPEMPLLLEETFTHVLLARLKAGDLDIAIVALPIGEPGLLTRAVYDEEFRVLVPAGHPWVSRRTIKPEDLYSEPLLMLGTGNCFRDQVLDLCAAATNKRGESPHVILDACCGEQPAHARRRHARPHHVLSCQQQSRQRCARAQRRRRPPLGRHLEAVHRAPQRTHEMALRQGCRQLVKAHQRPQRREAA